MSVMKTTQAMQLYTYEDYAKWDDDKRRELIDGVVYNMSAPSVDHQSVVLGIGVQLSAFLKGKKCKPFISPIDVRLKAKTLFKKDDTVVQPDVIVICDDSKISDDRKNIIGAPDLVIEVLSPSTGKIDRMLKYVKYEEAGVREYWIVDIYNYTVEKYVFENNPMTRNIYNMTERIPVTILDGFEMDLSEFVPPRETAPPPEDNYDE